MTENLEDVLRATFREQEKSLPAVELAGPAKALVARQNRRRTVVSGLAVVAILAGVAAVRTIDLPHPNGSVAATPQGDWSPRVSGEAQIWVPTSWRVGDYGCGMSQRPAVLVSRGAERECLTPETAAKEVAILDREPMLADTLGPGYSREKVIPAGVSARWAPVLVSGVAAERVEYRRPDGRYAGFVKIPSRTIVLSVRTKDPDRTRRILDSLKLVAVDAYGCGLAPKQDTASPSGRVVPRAATVAVCYYVVPVKGPTRRITSGVLAGSDATHLIDALNSSDPAPQHCGWDAKAYGGYRFELRAHDDAGRLVATVGMWFGTCGGLTGSRRVAITQPTFEAMMRALRIGGYFTPAFPGVARW